MAGAMSVVAFETATIADAIKKSDKAAPRPTKDAPHLSGILIDVFPDQEIVVLRASNGLVNYRQEVPVHHCESVRTTWLLPASILASVIETYDKRSGSTVVFTQAGNVVEITQARKKARLTMMDVSIYPMWHQFDEAHMSTVEDLGAKIGLIEWACDKELAQLGLRITEDALFATDKYVLARVPIKIPGLSEPVTIPPRSLAGMVPSQGELRIKVIGSQLLLCPDDQTQISCTTIGMPYLPVERAMIGNFENELRVAKSEFLTLIKTTQSVAKGDTQILRLFIDEGTMAGVLEEDGRAGIRDIIDVVGAEHETYEFNFNPVFLGNAISNAPDDFIVFKYNRSKLTVALIEGAQSGYQCWITPIRPQRG